MPCWLPVLCGVFKSVLPGTCVDGACERALASVSRVLWFLECVRPHPAMWCSSGGFMAAAVGAVAPSCAPVGPCLWAWFVPLWNVLSQCSLARSGTTWPWLKQPLRGCCGWSAWPSWKGRAGRASGLRGLTPARWLGDGLWQGLSQQEASILGGPVPLKQLGSWEAARA